MIGHFSEVVAILGTIKLLAASLPYFYGSPVGYLALMIIVGLIIGLWILIVRFTQFQDEFGSTQSNPVVATLAPAVAILAIGTPVAIQWNTFATPAQTAHLTCVVQTAGASTDRCFANWVKQQQNKQNKQNEQKEVATL